MIRYPKESAHECKEEDRREDVAHMMLLELKTCRCSKGKEYEERAEEIDGAKEVLR